MRRGSKDETFRALVVMGRLVSTTLSRNDQTAMWFPFPLVLPWYARNHIWCTQTLYDQMFDQIFYAHPLWSKEERNAGFPFLPRDLWPIFQWNSCEENSIYKIEFFDPMIEIYVVKCTKTSSKIQLYWQLDNCAKLWLKGIRFKNMIKVKWPVGWSS